MEELNKSHFTLNKKLEDHDYYNYVSKLIKNNELSSLIPYYLCEIDGHQTNRLDLVCLDENCKNKGVICFRCQYHQHNNHVNNCIPINTFMSNLIKNQNELSHLLAKKREKCYYLRENMIENVKQFIEKIIDEFSIFIASIHKYYQICEKQIENITIKSDVVMHRLFFKKHINHIQFNDYIKDVLSKINSPNIREIENIEITDYNNAIKITQDYVEEMSKWSSDLSNNLDKISFEAKKSLTLNIVYIHLLFNN